MSVRLEGFAREGLVKLRAIPLHDQDEAPQQQSFYVFKFQPEKFDVANCHLWPPFATY